MHSTLEVVLNLRHLHLLIRLHRILQLLRLLLFQALHFLVDLHLQVLHLQILHLQIPLQVVHFLPVVLQLQVAMGSMVVLQEIAMGKD
jgi:hypothetical protein